MLVDSIGVKEKVYIATLGCPKIFSNRSIGAEWYRQGTVNLTWLESGSLDLAILDPYLDSKLYINIINLDTLLEFELGKVASPKQKDLLAFKNWPQNTRILVALVKWSTQSHCCEPLLSVVSNGFDAVVVYIHLFVGVSKGDV